MSYILNALKKDHDNNEPLATVHSQLPLHYAEKSGNNNALLWGVLLTLAILGAVIIGYVLGRGYDPLPLSPKQIPMEQATDNTQRTKQALAANINSDSAAAPAPLVALPAKQKIAAEDYFDNPPVRQKVVVAPPVVKQTEPAQTKPIVTQENIASNTVDANQRVALEAADGVSDELLKLVQQAIDDTAQETNTSNQPAIQQPQAEAFDIENVPPLSAMPSNFQNQVPSIDFTMHIYSSKGDGWVRVNGKDAYEGDVIAEGLTLKKIDVQNVVLEFKGEVFTLPSMSQW